MNILIKSTGLLVTYWSVLCHFTMLTPNTTIFFTFLRQRFSFVDASKEDISWNQLQLQYYFLGVN